MNLYMNSHFADDLGDFQNGKLWKCQKYESTLVETKDLNSEPLWKLKKKKSFTVLKERLVK